MVVVEQVEAPNSNVPTNEGNNINTTQLGMNMARSNVNTTNSSNNSGHSGNNGHGGNNNAMGHFAPFGGLAALIPDSPEEGEGIIDDEENDHEDDGNKNNKSGNGSGGLLLTANSRVPRDEYSINHVNSATGISSMTTSMLGSASLPAQSHLLAQSHSHHPSSSQPMSSNNMAIRPASSAGPSRRESLATNNPILQMTENDAEEDSETESTKGERRSGRRKIQIAYIEDKSRRHITFSKRKAGIMKKAYELSTLTGTQVLLLVASETGHVYTFATPKLQPLITKPEGKNLIQACLNAPDPTANDYGVSTNTGHYDADEHGKDGSMYDDRSSGATSQVTSHQNAAAAASYAAAMANLAAFPYPTNAASAAFLNAATFPSTYAQYNAALAAGFWPGAATTAAGGIQGANNASNALASAAAVAAAASLKNSDQMNSAMSNAADRILQGNSSSTSSS